MPATRTPVVASLIVPLLLSTLASPAAAQLRDEAGFFGQDAARQASFDIRDIKQRFGVDLLVQTVPGIPADRQDQYQQLGREKFFEQWAEQRHREARISGAIVLISREPPYLRVSADRQTRERALPTTDVNAIREVMQTAFRAEQYDQGLLQGVATFRRALQQNLGDGAVAQARPGDGRPAEESSARGAPAPASEPRGQDDRGDGFSMSTVIIWAVVIFGGIWLVRRLIASRQRPTGPSGSPHPYPARGSPQQRPGYDPRHGGDPNDPRYGYNRGGGGGFGTGLGGGLLGGLLGGWLGGRVFGQGGQAHGGNTADATGGGPAEAGAGHLPQQDPGAFADDPGPEFAGSGGSFDAGGGDFGGDSGSGGDF